MAAAELFIEFAQAVVRERGKAGENGAAGPPRSRPGSSYILAHPDNGPVCQRPRCRHGSPVYSTRCMFRI